jgi:CMP-N,N'-diacetyllegionaminic acid synthase
MIEIKKNVLKKVKKLKKKVVRRQDAPKVYEMNASIYIWSRKTLLSDMKIINNRTSYYIMPYNRSIDIDNIDDFNYVNHLMKRNDKRIRK